MTVKDHETRLYDLLKEQKELYKSLRTEVGKYYDLKKIADKLETVEEELWDNKVFGKEDVPFSLENKYDDLRTRDRIYYLFGFMKDDEKRRSENYFNQYGKYLMHVPNFYYDKDYAFYYNLKGGSKLVDIKDRHDFEYDNYVIVGKRPSIIYRNVLDYNELMQVHQPGYREVNEDFSKYQHEYYDILSNIKDEKEAAKRTYMLYGKNRRLSK